MLNVADAERAGLRLNCSLNETSLRAARRFDLPGPLLEFAIGAKGDGEEVIKPREKIMFAVVPALGALLQDVVVSRYDPFFTASGCGRSDRDDWLAGAPARARIGLAPRQ